MDPPLKRKSSQKAIVMNKRQKTGLNYRQQAQVNRLIAKAQELKIHDVIASVPAITTGTHSWCLTTIPLGTSNGERVGESVRIPFIKLNTEIKLSGSYQTAPTPNPSPWKNNFDVRLTLYTCKQNTVVGEPNANGSFIYEGITNPRTILQYNWDNRKQYKIIMDDVYHMSTYDGNPCTKRYKIKIPKKYQEIEYNTGSVLGTNHIYAQLSVSNILAVDGTTQAVGIVFSHNGRVFYYDS